MEHILHLILCVKLFHAALNNIGSAQRCFTCYIVSIYGIFLLKHERWH